MNSNPFLLFLSFLLFQGSQHIGGVEQKRAEYNNVVVTDGLELHKVFDSVRRNTPTTASSLNDEEERDLESAPATGVEDSISDSLGDESSKDVVEKTLANSRSQVLEDKDSSHDGESKELSNNERRLTPKNDRGSKNRHDVRANRNFGQNERLNIDSERNKDQRHGVRDSLAREGKNKLAQTAEQGKTAELESNGGFAVVPDSNSSTSTPPPYILKVKNTPARAELDDIYFLFIVIGCSVAGIAGLALAGYCWYKLHTTAKAVSEAEYSSYGATKQGAHVTQGDHKLDYSAEIYHYQQTKSQLSAMEKASGTKGGIKGETLDDDENSDEGDDEDYTVYECHGLAPTGDMTVVNPLFSDQEVVGSDQDGNGDKSGASGQGSPVAPRHSLKES